MRILSPRRAVLRVILNRNVTITSFAKFQYPARFSSSSSAGLDSKDQLVSRRSTRSSGSLKTVKEYSALPERLVSISGTPVEPLPPWDGGLGIHQTRDLQNAASASSEKRPHVLLTGVTEDSLDTERSKHSRNRQTRKGLASQTQDDTSIVDALDNGTSSLPGTPASRRRPRNQLAKEILENLARFPHCILLTRVGQFYESYFDQAQEVSRLLSIKLAKRTWDDQRVWMCGFPLMHLDKHLKVLVQQHKRSVAMCEEFRKPRNAGDDFTSKPSFERRVVRILTPGTLIDEPFLNPYENNFLLAVSEDDAVSGRGVGLAWIDVSTGEFYARSASLDTFKDHIARISPQEAVLDERFRSNPDHPVRKALMESNCPISFSGRLMADMDTMVAPSNEILDDVVDQGSLDDASPIFSSSESAAIAVLTAFLQANLLEHAPQSLRPFREDKSRRMQIDSHTLKALEIREGMREGGTSGSLMSSIKRTVTSSGARLLSRWLCSPSTSLEEIMARQSLVNLFRTRPNLRVDLIELLKGAEDAMRISQRFLLGKGGVDDLVSIRSTIGTWEVIRNRIALEKDCEKTEAGRQFAEEDWQALDRLINRMVDLSSLAERIESAIDPKELQAKESAPDESEDKEAAETHVLVASDIPKLLSLPGVDTKWTIKSQFSAQLASLHERFYQLQHERDQTQKKYQERYDAPSLTLRHSATNGLHVHIARPRRDSARLDKSRHFVPLAESKSTRTYFNQASFRTAEIAPVLIRVAEQEWFALGNAILETVTAIYNAERDAFLTLRHETNVEAPAIRKNARILDELDVTSAFAALASEMNFVRPTISESSTFYVENGRHPTVELGLLQSGRMFTPNTIVMSESSRLHIVTGPNMGGKSTYLRQAALIAILAQIGSFVPADAAHIGLVDKVFSRIGAKDDLFRDRSTFMVEMLESAEILKNATEKSLVIMDEVGRGTTVQDGLAIAFATIHHLYLVNKSRTLFATHFHELVDMLGFSDDFQFSKIFPALEFYCTDIDEIENGLFTYSHRMRRGVNRNSHGLKVAQLAGMPALAMSVAEEALASLKRHNRSSSSLGDLSRDIGHKLVMDRRV